MKQALAGIYVKPAGAGYYAYNMTELLTSNTDHTISLSGVVKLNKDDQVFLHVASEDGSYSMVTGTDCSLLYVAASSVSPAGAAVRFSQRLPMVKTSVSQELTQIGNWTLTDETPMASQNFNPADGKFYVRGVQKGLYHVSINAQMRTLLSQSPVLEVRKNGAPNPALTGGMAGSFSGDTSDAAVLAEVMPGGAPVKWKLCYRLSVDGRGSTIFHNKVCGVERKMFIIVSQLLLRNSRQCDSRGATVSIYTNQKGIRFGGYIDM